MELGVYAYKCDPGFFFICPCPNGSWFSLIGCVVDFIIMGRSLRKQIFLEKTAFLSNFLEF